MCRPARSLSSLSLWRLPLRVLCCLAVALLVRSTFAQDALGTSRRDFEVTKAAAPDTPTADASVMEIIDYHQVRGRKSLRNETGLREGELDFLIAGNSRVQGMSSFGPQWSGNAHLLWDGVVGDSMASSFEVERSGEYSIAIQLTLAGDYGVFQMTLPNTSVSRRVDLYSSRVELAPMIRLEKVRLEAGSQPIVFELIGANEKARKYRDRGYLMGLDFIQLKPLFPLDDDTDSKVSGSGLGVQSGVQARESGHRDPSSLVKALTQSELAELTRTLCIDCHNGDSEDTDVVFSKRPDGQSWKQNPELLQRVRNAIGNHEMPPETADQPTNAQRLAAVKSLELSLAEYFRKHPGSVSTTMRRMTRYEYNNAVKDLLQLRGDLYPLPEKTLRASSDYFQPAMGHSPRSILIGNRTLGKNQVERQILTGVTPFAVDLQAEGGFNNRADELGFSPILLESLLRLGRSIVHSPEFDDYCGLSASVFESPVNGQATDRVVHERIATLLERAFRSKIDNPTINRYLNYFKERLKKTDSFRDAMKDVVAAILASPRFVYLAESSGPESKPTLNAYELATRLSFFLWSSIPDEELLAAARDGSLIEQAVLDEQTRRMLGDPKCHALTQNFARQWLRLDQLVTAVPDFERFPRYYSRIGCEQWKFGLQMMVEPLLLFDSIVMEDRSIMLLIDSNYTYRSDELQSWYTDEVPFGDRENRNRFNTNQQQYKKRSLTDRREGGVITTAATMTMTSSPLRTNPITRGAWVATVILNRPPPPPPDIVPPIEADDREIESLGITLRERLDQHQSEATCAACHSKIDPLGFVLENYDAVGRWRDEYTSGLEIDSSGELLGKLKFRDVIELKDELLQHPELFMRAFSEHLLSYALGRKLDVRDEPTVDAILSRVMEDRGQFTTVIREIVMSDAFRLATDTSDLNGAEAIEASAGVSR